MSKSSKPKQSHVARFKTPMRYRLMFINENSLTQVWSIKMSRKRIIFVVAVMVFAVICVGAMLISFTPLRTLLPGYLKGAERREYLAANERIDSLLNVVAVNDRYLNNLNAIILGEISGDSLLEVPLEPVPLDTARLLGRSALEAEFVKKYGARIPIDSLPRLLADAPAFVAPVRNSVVTGHGASGSPEFVFNDTKNPVYAIAMGRLIDVTGGSDEGFTVVCQHPDGYLTRYSGLSKVNYGRGQEVASGSQIGQYVVNKDVKFGFELYRDGIRVNPLEYIMF